jgi:hypothetical protein
MYKCDRPEFASDEACDILHKPEEALKIINKQKDTADSYILSGWNIIETKDRYNVFMVKKIKDNTNAFIKIDKNGKVHNIIN